MFDFLLSLYSWSTSVQPSQPLVIRPRNSVLPKNKNEELKYADKYKFLLTNAVNKNEITQNNLEWHINLGILKNIRNRTKDEKIKKFIDFLSLNYLCKAAVFEKGRVALSLTDKIGENVQLSPETGGYFRYNKIFSENLEQKLLSYFNQGKESVSYGDLTYYSWIFSRNSEIEEILSLKFKVINFYDHFKKNKITSEDDLIKELCFIRESNKQNDIVIDVSDYINEITNKQNKNFFYEFDKFCSTISFCQIINELSMKFLERNLSKEQKAEIENKMKKFMDITRNTPLPQIIANTEINGTQLTFFRANRSPLQDFFNESGLQEGTLSMRKNLLDWMALDEWVERNACTPVEYAYKKAGNGKDLLDTICFENMNEITSTNLFKTFFNDDKSKINPAIHQLCIATCNEIAGLFGENGIITQDNWNSIKQNKDLSSIVQTVLYRLNEHLAMAKLNKTNFDKFVEYNELVACELSTLYAVFTPYSMSDVDRVFKEKLNPVIPNVLKPYMKVGLARSAMNFFAHVGAVAKRIQHTEGEDSMMINCSSNTYYEVLDIIQSKEEIKHSIYKNALLYVLYNPCMSVDEKLDIYETNDIIKDINKILISQNRLENLTVAIDCTTDFTFTGQLKNVLENFKEEIISGKVNIIWASSGQKFELQGKDHAIGCPFGVIGCNNRIAELYQAMVSDPIIQTDNLSTQIYCAYAQFNPDAPDKHLKLIVDNTRHILDNIPDVLKPGGNSMIKIPNFSSYCSPFFIPVVPLMFKHLINNLNDCLQNKLFNSGVTFLPKSSFGFCYPNTDVINGKILRVTVGINQENNEVFIDFFNELSRIIQTVESLPFSERENKLNELIALEK